MIFNVISEAASGPWCINPETMAQLRPLFKQVLSGASLGIGEEPLQNKSYLYFLNDNGIKAWSQPEEDIENEEVVETAEFSPVINVVPIRGIMFKNDQECGPRGTRTIGQRLMEADADKMVIGHIIIFETPGGTLDAINELEPVMLQLTKPFVGWIDDMMCSAGEWIGSYCKELIAGKATAIIGSIGVMNEWEGRTSKSEANAMGEVSVTIYSDGSSDKNAAYETAINNFDFKLAKESLNKYYDRFVGVIKANRPNCTEDQLHGKTFEASELVGTLIDAIGPFQMAVDRVIALSNFKPQVQQQTKEANSNSHLNNKVTMKQFAKVNGVLGVEQLEATEEGAFLQEAQIEAIETALDTQASELATAQTDLATAQQTAQDAATAQETAEGTLAATLAALDAIGPTVAAAKDVTTKVASIKTLLVAKLAQPPVGMLAKDKELDNSEEFDGFSAEEKELTKNL